MVKAELSYNPYLQETEIRFNGQSPRINSHVEKYQDQKLQTWIHKLPHIFRDEMNGYGFELEFTGTKLDYEELKKSFSNAGVSDAQVHIFHKNELDGRDVKLEKIDQLLNWLEEFPNRRYDIKKIRKDNYDLFDEDYEYIILHGRITDPFVFKKLHIPTSRGTSEETEAERSPFEKLHIAIENVDRFDELKDTNLHNIPILYIVDQHSVALMREDLRALQKRQDVSKDQIFFWISPNLSEEKVVREISDLGISEPQVVLSADDPIVIKYFELFPFTDYIRDTIKLFREHISALKEELTTEISAAETENQEQHTQIEQLDVENACLKESLDKFINPDRTDFSVFFLSTVEDIKNKIMNWRNNKTKITQPEEAVRVAREYDSYVQELYQDYLRKMHSILVKSANSVQVQMRNWYDLAFADAGFIPGRIQEPDYAFDSIPSFQNELLKIKEESYVTPKEDFLGRFFKPAAESGTGPVLETTFYYAWWRAYALNKAEPYLYNIYTTCVEKLNSYFDQLGSCYKEHLQIMIAEKETAKNSLSSHLSEEERQRQDDNDWLIRFSDAVKAIAKE